MKIDNYKNKVLKLYNLSSLRIPFERFYQSVESIKDPKSINKALGLCKLCERYKKCPITISNYDCVESKIKILKEYKIL